METSVCSSYRYLLGTLEQRVKKAKLDIQGQAVASRIETLVAIILFHKSAKIKAFPQLVQIIQYKCIIERNWVNLYLEPNFRHVQRLAEKASHRPAENIHLFSFFPKDGVVFSQFIFCTFIIFYYSTTFRIRQ
jgi:hypothetical protein